jgi:hypothetical protein
MTTSHLHGSVYGTHLSEMSSRSSPLEMLIRTVRGNKPGLNRQASGGFVSCFILKLVRDLWSMEIKTINHITNSIPQLMKANN